VYLFIKQQMQTGLCEPKADRVSRLWGFY